ncbi:hypothetical protein ACIQUM_33265 [Amycolatopsis azurea]|uniref:hypothetical protein n=1 Tax=Amycolatopsis azurea TaxID=36819 RepID=UPI0037FE1ABF
MDRPVAIANNPSLGTPLAIAGPANVGALNFLSRIAAPPQGIADSWIQLHPTPEKVKVYP